MTWIEQLRNSIYRQTPYSLDEIILILNVEQKNWKHLHAELKQAVTDGLLLMKTGGCYMLPSSSSSSHIRSASFLCPGPPATGASAASSSSSSTASSSSSEVVVVNEVSLEQRLADGSKTAIDLTPDLMKVGLTLTHVT